MVGKLDDRWTDGQTAGWTDGRMYLTAKSSLLVTLACLLKIIAHACINITCNTEDDAEVQQYNQQDH